MTPVARLLLFALALAVPATFAHANGSAPAALCKQGIKDSVPSRSAPTAGPPWTVR